jgi:hypothetical protein
MNLARLVLVGTTIAAMFTAGVEARDEHDDHAAAPAALVKVVRDVTEPFRDPAIAGSAGYGPLLGCVSGQQEGAMGLHLVNGGLVFDEGKLDPEQPEALMYEMRGGRLQLLGVEYIVPAAAWHEHNQAPPALLGQSFAFVDSPNRFGLEPFYELHVWAWRENPHGTFVDWNPRVSCDGFSQNPQ